MPGIIFFYLRLIFNANRSATNPQGLAGWCLLNKKSFRTSDNSFGPIQVTKRLIRNVFSRDAKGFRKFEIAENGVAVWDNRDVSQIRFDHISFNGGQQPSFFIERSNLQVSGAVRIVVALIYFLLWPWLALWSIFSSNAKNIALLYDEWTEAIALVRLVRKHKIKYVYFYCPYEADANALYLLLKKENVTVNKIPSPNLLAAHNQELLSDVVTLTSPCQLDELTTYKATISVGEIIKWLPEQFAAYASVYKSMREKPASFTIGYYSHASWVRRMDGKSSDLGDVEAEFELVPIVGNFLRANRQFRCIVFLHPKEKKKDVLPMAQKYYDEHLGTENYMFADTGESASRSFDAVNIGLGALSTILFERLFLGCKTIFYPSGIKIFPAEGSSLSAICPVSATQLESIILQCAEESTQTFLEKRDLRKYTIFNWKPGSGYAEQN